MLTLALGLADDVILPVSAVAGAGGPSEKSYPIPAADGVSIDRGARVILVRHANHVYAFSMACPHEQAAVKWLKKDNRFQCSKHDSEQTGWRLYDRPHDAESRSVSDPS